jgi:hypothetical protein
MIEERRNLKGENPLTYEKLIFRNGQPVCADDRIIFVSYLDLHNETDNGGRFKKSNSTKNVMTSHFQ